MNEIVWEIRVPIFKSSIIVKQLLLAIGLPFGILTVFLFYSRAYYALIMIAALFVVTFILSALVFRGTYDVKYRLNEDGIECKSTGEQRKKVGVISALSFFLGMFTWNFSAAGAGVLSGAGMDRAIPWSQVKKIKYDEKQKTVTALGTIGDSTVIFCTEDNFGIVKKYVETMMRR